jgi:methyl-accepting chemotaxis protein
MVKDITDVKEDAAGLSTASHEVKTNAQSLSELGNRLTGLMGKFKV